MTDKLKFAVIGTGFWANYQIPAWLELHGVELVALYNRTPSKAEALARKYEIPAVYDRVDKMLEIEDLDFVDIITDVDTHLPFTQLAAQKGVTVICQKPMAPKLNQAQEMVNICRYKNVPLFIHENWRWQAPIRKVKSLLLTNKIGKVFKARISFCSSFPVFDNQPFLATLEEFILTDIGSHILDVCRFLFGEAETLYCNVASINPGIKGEDAAQVFIKTWNGVACYAEMSYASILEHESFPQTYLLIEGELGSIHLMRDYKINVTLRTGTETITAMPSEYTWADPAYALVHSSIVECNRDILQALQGKSTAETTGTDNLETVRLVHAAYASARSNTVINLATFQ